MANRGTDVNDGSEFNPDVEYEDIGPDAADDLDDDFGEYESSNPRMEDLKARGREALSGAAEAGKKRLADAAKRSKERIAEKLEDAASQIDGRLFYGADYLRTTDIEVIRDDFIDVVRKRPLLSAGIAIGAGFLIGKVMGVGSGGSRRKRGGSNITSQVGRALVGSLAAMAASRLRNGPLVPDDSEDEEEPVRRHPPRTRPRSSRSRTRAEYE